MIKIRFTSNAGFIDKNYNKPGKYLQLQIGESTKEGIQPLLCKTSFAEWINNSYNFGFFEFTSDIFKSATHVKDKILSIEVIETPDLSKPKQKQLIGKCEVVLKDALKHAQSDKSSVHYLLDKSVMPIGSVEIRSL